VSRLRSQYRETIAPDLRTKLQIASVHAVPRVTKVVVNMGVGEGSREHKFIDAAVADLTAITGQRPVVTRARKSIANFKIRDGMPVGVRVTLRGSRMYEFMDRLINIALPRVHDFRGVSDRAFDGRGNYTLGLTDQSVFPEIDYSKIEKTRGMNVTICTTATRDDEARALLRAFGMPFARREA
jgi:large subunit ribosomal protein L5